MNKKLKILLIALAAVIVLVIGAVIILAVTIDVVRNKMEAKARKMAAA